MISHGKDIKVFCGNSNPALAQEICQLMGTKLGESEVKAFADGEVSVSLYETVRGSDVFVVQSTCNPVNNNLMELLIMIDALRRASAGRITAVVPFFGYARQDRKAKPRDPISAKLVANMITAAGADRVLTMDLHAAQIQGFFDIPVDNLAGNPIFVDYYAKKFGEKCEDMVVVSPDVGSVARARAFAQKLHMQLAIVDKRRQKANQSEVMNVIGDVSGKDCIIFDDMCDTCGTLVNAAKALVDIGGAKSVHACATHAVLSGPAVERINNSVITELALLNTIPPVDASLSDRLPADHPLRLSYETYMEGERRGRSSWDLLALYYVLEPDSDCFTAAPRGRLCYEQESRRTWWRDEQGRADREVRLAIPPEEMAARLEELLVMGE